MKKSQIAIELFMTYGWIILTFLISGGTIAYYIFSTHFCPPDFQISGQTFSISDQKFIGSDSSLEDMRNFFYIIIKNNLPETIRITEVSINKKNIECSTFTIPGGGYVLKENEVSKVIQGELTNEQCQGKVKHCYKFNTVIKYSKISSTLDRSSTGYIAGSFEGINEYWTLGETWTSTLFGSSIVENRNYEKLNICNPETPLTGPGAFPGTVPPGIITWDLPNGCRTSGIAQVGFSNACSTTARYLSKGWIHNTLYIDPIFSNYKVYLGGNAEYYDEDDGKQKTNGICMNDNLYFYVNGALKYYGGTTGVMVGAANTYQSGDEVLRGCGNCQAVDSSAWCIPAFELTTAGFHFGAENNIDILVEDFCKGSGQQHAGGMSQLSVTMA